MKIIFLILDGLGDRPIKELGNKTPLEAAKTPNFNFLAGNGLCGLITPTYQGSFPTSKDAHLSLFGYDLKKWWMGRGIFEAIGAGARVKKGDVALRGNFATVDTRMKIIDRRAGRIEDTGLFIKALDGIKIKGIKFILIHSTSQRVAVILRGRGLSENISDGDFHKTGIIAPKIYPKTQTKAAKFTAEVLNEFLAKAHQILKAHSFNAKRIKKGLLAANYILIREPGILRKIPSFQKVWGMRACCIAGGKLYQGIGKILGMRLIEVKGATGRPNTNIRDKFKAAKEAVKKYNFVYCHIKGTDEFGHDGNCLGKKDFIEKIDGYLPILFGIKNVLLIITGDHSTPCELKEHSTNPLPVVVYPVKSAIGGVPPKAEQFNGVYPVKCRKAAISPSAKLFNRVKFSEKDCQKGKLGRIRGIDFFKKIVKMYL